MMPSWTVHPRVLPKHLHHVICRDGIIGAGGKSPVGLVDQPDRPKALVHENISSVGRKAPNLWQLSASSKGGNWRHSPQHAQRFARQQLGPNVTRLDVHAPRLAHIRQPGQFVIVRLGDHSERIPLTIACDADSSPLIIEAVGKVGTHLRPATISQCRRPAGHPAIIPSGRPPGSASHWVIFVALQGWVILKVKLRRLGDVVVLHRR